MRRHVLSVSVTLLAVAALGATRPRASHGAAPAVPMMPVMHADSLMDLHMELSPARRASAADSARARALVATVRQTFAKYRDTATAVADGYRMFLPNVKNQHVYHFTNYGNAFAEAFRFDPTKPTSLLYQRGADGRLALVGVMYSAPRQMSLEQLDARVPLGIARWHRHVNLCIPRAGEGSRWLEQRDGHPVFGPDSPIATREACDAAGGRFIPAIFGWMVHVNAFAGDDLATIFGDEHAMHDAMSAGMHDGMSEMR